MSNFFSVEVDWSEVTRAFEALGDDAVAELRADALVTAGAIRDDARVRLNRQTHGTGQTAENLTVSTVLPGRRADREEEAAAYVYATATGRPANLPHWLEHGTVKMTARPFIVNAARGQEDPHRQRVERTLTRLIAAEGL